MTSSGEYVAFVSYASENREKAEEICANLERRGLPCWIAPRNVRAGHEYADEILLGIERSAALVLVLSEAANASPFVSREVERAVAKEKPLFPVRIEEVMPASGLELLVSADHWTDVWTGRWDGHMDRLARDLSDRVRGTGASRTSSRRLALSGGRSFGVFGGMAALIAGGGLAMWSLSGETSTREVEAPVPANRPAASVDPPSVRQVQREREEIPAGEARAAPSDATTRPAQTSDARRRDAPPRPAPATRATATPSPPAVETGGSLNAFKEIYDDLALRGSVIDDTLNQLWEEMKPASPRIDMANSQRRLKTNLARGRQALEEKDAAAARKYLDAARVDLEVLERFMNR